MVFNQRHVCLFIGAVLVVVSFNPTCAESDNAKKDQMDSFFPLLFMMGGAPPTVHSPVVWMMGILCLGVIAFLGKGITK